MDTTLCSNDSAGTLHPAGRSRVCLSDGICSAGRIGTTLCLEHTCMPHEALRLTVKPSHNVTSWPANWSSTSRLYGLAVDD